MKFALPRFRPAKVFQVSYSLLLFILLAGSASMSSCAFHTSGRQVLEQVNRSPDGDAEFWKAVKQGDVIYVGETHTDPAHHEYQLQLIRGMLARKFSFAIGWEMFDWTQQPLLDDWYHQKISWDELSKRTDFQRNWGIYSPFYSEILKVAEQSRIRNIALNAPSDLPRKVAHGENLTVVEKQMMPEGFVASEGAFQNFVSMIGDHPGMQQSDLRRFFEAQEVWDQTMAARILEFKGRNPKVKLVVLTGRGHLLGGYGIPFFVRQKASLKQLILFPRGRNDLRPGQKAV
jgi:uncharacterized iron-regulated protein